MVLRALTGMPTPSLRTRCGGGVGGAPEHKRPRRSVSKRGGRRQRNAGAPKGQRPGALSARRGGRRSRGGSAGARKRTYELPGGGGCVGPWGRGASPRGRRDKAPSTPAVCSPPAHGPSKARRLSPGLAPTGKAPRPPAGPLIKTGDVVPSAQHGRGAPAQPSTQRLHRRTELCVLGQEVGQKPSE